MVEASFEMGKAEKTRYTLSIYAMKMKTALCGLKQYFSHLQRWRVEKENKKTGYQKQVSALFTTSTSFLFWEVQLILILTVCVHGKNGALSQKQDGLLGMKDPLKWERWKTFQLGKKEKLKIEREERRGEIQKT